MSWFTKFVEHPFVAAFASLETNPAITGNTDAANAVATAKQQAQTLAAAASTGVSTVLAAAQSAEDPSIAALGTGLTAAIDAFLTAALGPLGEEIVAPAANTVIALGEEKAHNLISALFAHASAQVQTVAKPSA